LSLYAFSTGRAGHDPALLAALCKYELGAQLSDQVTYPNTRVGDKGEALTGERKYVLHFEKGKLPPVSVFWNLAMYSPDMFFVENEIDRYSIGSTTDGLTKNADGSRGTNRETSSLGRSGRCAFAAPGRSRLAGKALQWTRSRAGIDGKKRGSRDHNA
jgi:Protein of unknown function (DUF1214)